MNELFNFFPESFDLVNFGLIWLFIFVFLMVIKKIIASSLNNFFAKLGTAGAELVKKILEIWSWMVLALLALYIASGFVTLSGPITKLTDWLVFVIISWFAIRTAQVMIRFGFARYIERRQQTEEDFDPTIIHFLRQVVSIFVWILAILVVVQNLGYQVSALIGGLGIGGLAIAFAVQNLLSDIFSSISIYFDKPFKIGDFIVVGNDSGIVKRIGIKSTRIQTLNGQELIISNKELTEVRVNNFKRMQRRRVVLKIGVEYGTPIKKLKKIPGLIKAAVESHEELEFDRAHFEGFGDFSLNFEVVYFVNSPEYGVFMDLQQSVNLAILAMLEKEAVSIAFPTQKILTMKAS